MQSDPRDILLFIIAALNVVFGFLVLFRRKLSWVNITYSIVVLAIALWSFGLVYFRNAERFEDALFWARIYYLAAAVIAYAFLMFGLVFPYIRFKFSWWKHAFLAIPFITVLYLVYTPYHIETIFIQDWGKDVILGWGYIIYTVFFIVYMSIGFLSMYKKGKESVGIRKMQIKYVLIGTLIAAIGGSLFNLFYPLVGNYQYIWLGPLFTFIMVIFIGYAIVKYRLMNIRLILSRISHHIFSFITSFAIVEFTFYFFGMFKEELFARRTVLISSILSIAVILLHDPLQKVFSKITSRIFFRGQTNYQKLLKDIVNIISKQVSRDGLSYSVSKNLYQELQVKYARIYIKEKKVNLYKIAGSLQEPIKENSAIINELNKVAGILVTEELELRQNDTPNKDEYVNLENLVKELHKFDIALIAPIVLEDELIAIIALGQKKSGDIFDKELVAIFDVLCPQIATALAKAKLYDESLKFNVKLKSEVAKATLELRKANKRLTQMDQSKSEFLSIAAHQLRTPITGIKGYVSMFLENDFGPLTQEQRFELEKIYRSSDRLTRLIDVFLNVSRIETGNLELKKEKFDIMEIIHDVVSDLDAQAKKKNLKVTVQNTGNLIPEIFADKDKMHDVVMNLLDNAVKYTEKGWINIKMSSSKSLLTFEVKDSGIGISSEEIDKLFQKFSRAEAISRIHTGGSGLGLFIARKIIETHGGKIWAESQGKDKGSTFTFTLPIKPL